MDKHNIWLKGRKNLNNSREFESFSLFQLVLKFILSINLLLSIIMLVDFVLEPKQKNGKCERVYFSELTIAYNDRTYEKIEINDKIEERIEGSEIVDLYLTPIFEHGKYYLIEYSDGSTAQISKNDILLILLFVIINLAAFLLLVVFPNIFDSETRDLDVEVKDVVITRYDLFDHIKVILVLIGIPAVVGLIYWIKLYNFVFD